MVTVRRIILFVFFLTSIGFILYTGIARYTGYQEYLTHTPEEVKLAAEDFLFVSIVISVGLLIIMSAIFLMSRNIYRELDRVNDPVRFGNFSPEMNFKRLGILGDKINKLYHNLNEVNEGKTLKISSLDALLSFLLKNIRLPLLIANITGTIVYASKQYCDKFGVEKSGILQKSIQELLGESRFIDIAGKFEESRTPFVSEDKKILFYPIFNMHNTVSEIVCIWDHSEVITAERSEPKIQSAKSRGIRGLIRRRIDRKIKTK